MLPGYAFRSYAGESDQHAMLGVRQQLADVDGADPISRCEAVPSLEAIENSVDSADIADRFILMTMHKQIIGYAEIAWWLEADGTWVYKHDDWIAPGYRTFEAHQALLGNVQKKIRKLAADHGTTANAIFASNASEIENCKSDVLAADGYRRMWTLVEMKLTSFSHLHPAPLPMGIDVRMPQPMEYRDLQTINRAVYKGTFGQAAEEDYADFVAEALNQPELCAVAYKENRIVGFALACVRRGYGDINEVTITPTWRRRGLARALLTRVLVQFPARGINAVRLQTDADNRSGARILYEQLGFQPLRLHYRYRKPLNAG